MKLSIIIPVFNEKATIEEILTRVVNAPSLNFQKEIIVVDDGSNDGTSSVLEKLRKEVNFILLKHNQNLGKGSAVKTGLDQVSGKVVLIQDADLEYNPKDYPALLEAINKGTPVVYGARLFTPKNRGYFYYIWGAKLLNFLINLLFAVKLTDVYTGYKVFSTPLIKDICLKSSGFELEAEITAKILKRDIKIKEVPIHYYPRTFSQGKKIRPIDGLIGVFTILKYWLD